MTLETSSLRRTACGLAAFFLLLWVGFRAPKAPTSHGHPLSFWLRQLRLDPAFRHSETSEALVALHDFATNDLRQSLTQRPAAWTALQTRLHHFSPSLVPHPRPIESSRTLALNVLQRLEGRASVYIPDLVQGFRITTLSDTREAIAQILRKLGTDGIAALSTLAMEPDFAGSEIAIRTLDESFAALPDASEMRSHWTAIACARLLSADVNVILAATRAVARLGLDGSPGIPQILQNLSHSSVAVRVASAEALARIGQRDPHSVPALIAALDDPSGDVRTAAAMALGRFGAEATAAVPRLEHVLVHDSIPVVLAALQTLGRIGPSASEAVPEIAERLGDDSAPALLKSAAATSLGRIARDTDHAIPALERAIRDPDAYVRCQAARALSAYGVQAAACLPALSEALFDPTEAVRIHAAEALGSMGPAALPAVPALIAARNNNQSVMSPPVVAALARIQGSTTAPSGAPEFSPNDLFPDKPLP